MTKNKHDGGIVSFKIFISDCVDKTPGYVESQASFKEYVQIDEYA